MKVLKLPPPPTDDKHSAHRISSTFQAKTTWGGNILLGQDCLLKIWTNMTWNFPLLLNIFCGSKSSSSSSQFWNDFELFYSISIPSKNYTFSQTVKSSWTLSVIGFHLNFYKCFDALLSLNFWHSRSVEEVNLIPLNFSKVKLAKKNKEGNEKNLPWFLSCFYCSLRLLKSQANFFQGVLLAKLDCDQISTFLHDFH